MRSAQTLHTSSGMKTQSLLTPILVAAFLPLAACSPKNTAEPAPTQTESDVEPVDAFLEQARQDLDALENEWIRTREKAKGDSALEAEMSVVKDELEEGFKEAKSQLEELSQATDENFARAKQELESELEDIREQITDMQKKMEAS